MRATADIKWRAPSAEQRYSSESSDSNHEESDDKHEEEAERFKGSKSRSLYLSADRCENQGAERLAGRDARAGPKAHQGGRPRSRRGDEMEKAIELDARDSSVGARRHHLHRRDVQGRREADLRQGAPRWRTRQASSTAAWKPT